jgi:multidrug efflux pump subunit AcrA (membrane-fusion protein)
MLRKLLIIPALGVGVLALVLMMRGREGPPERPDQEVTRTVRVIAVPRTAVVPRAVGYGEVRPGRVWQAVAQVGGRIVELSPRVREGEFASAKTVLVRIDRADSDLQVKAAEARIASLAAQLAETDIREETLQASLAIEKASLGLAESELARLRKLAEKGTVPKADVDREERNVLTQKLRVQDLESNLKLLEPQREVTKAELERERSNLALAKLSVMRTEIAAPFDLRIGQVKVEQDQVVQPGQTLFSADGTDTSEVTAWIPLSGVRHVLAPGMAKVVALTELEDLPRQLGLTATIHAPAGAGQVIWPGKVVRVRGIDNQTRTLGIDVAVAKPYEGVVPGKRPPLVPDLYVRVDLRAEARPDQVVVPRSALHEDRVYLVGGDGRLRIAEVDVAFVQDEHAIIEAGLAGGESLVLTDLVPAIEGTRLEPVEDAKALRALLADAGGEANER